MKRIYYTLRTLIEDGVETREVAGAFKSIPYSEDNLEIAKQEAWNGEYTIEDDGEPEPDPTPTAEPVTWDELDAAYQAGYDEGYTEGVNGAYDNE